MRSLSLAAVAGVTMLLHGPPAFAVWESGTTAWGQASSSVPAIDGAPAPLRAGFHSPSEVETATPIKHLVVIFQENTSFDSMFATYPHASNPPGAPFFKAKRNTPAVNGLEFTLLKFNPNGSNPFRISREDSYVCDTSHKYAVQLGARNGGLMNKFLEFGVKGPGQPPQFCHQSETTGQWDTDMGYFDGNSVTALWNYAQNFAMSDNSFGTLVGESSRGAQILARADVTNALCVPASNSGGIRVYSDPSEPALPLCNGPVDNTNNPPPQNSTRGVLVNDLGAYYDICSIDGDTTAFAGENIGDFLNDAGITWGWFQGGFNLSDDGTCSSSHTLEAWEKVSGKTSPEFVDYTSRWNPFQYFQSTANPKHTPPESLAEVGYGGAANHIYDLEWFWRSVEARHLPSVTFLKAPVYQSGHPGQSDPLDEQVFIVSVMNAVQELRLWKETLVIIAWDDSDSLYDHVMPPIVNTSNTSEDNSLCGEETMGPGTRCAYGPRLPFLVVSPFAKRNYVSGVTIDQSSILRFIQDNWLGGLRITDESFDNMAGSIEDMLDFTRANRRRVHRWPRRLFLDPENGLKRRH